MAKKEFIYRVDEAKKVVYIDETATPTPTDQLRYTSYISAGYKTHKKSQKKVVVQGLDGYIVAEKNGQLLVCSLKEEQRIKEFGK